MVEYRLWRRTCPNPVRWIHPCTAYTFSLISFSAGSSEFPVWDKATPELFKTREYAAFGQAIRAIELHIPALGSDTPATNVLARGQHLTPDLALRGLVRSPDPAEAPHAYFHDLMKDDEVATMSWTVISGVLANQDCVIDQGRLEVTD